MIGTTYPIPQPPPPPSSPNGHQVTFRFENISSGNPSVFKVGEQWRITITGQPGARVIVAGYHDSYNFQVDLGEIDANGNFTKTGTVTQTDVGLWSEVFYAGGATAGTVQFSVVKPDTTPPPATSVNGQVNAPPTLRVPGPGYNADALATSSPPDFIKDWRVIALAVAALFLFTRK